MTRRKFQAMNQNYSKVTSGLSLIVCLLLSTADGLPQVYKVPQWIHQRSPNGVVHVFFMHHEPLLMNNWFPDNLVDKELSRTFSAFTDIDSNEPKVERFYHKLLIDIGKSPLSSLKEHDRIQTQRRQEEIQWSPNKNMTTAEETMKRLKRQVTGKYNNGSNTTTSIPTEINERKQDGFLPPNILDRNNINTSNYKSNTALYTMDDSPVDTSNISAVSNTTITEPEILAKAINDEEYGGDEDRDILRTFLQSITVNPDDMEPRETQDIITNGDIVTALVFPMFLILMIGTTIYIVQKFRSNYMQRWQGHRRHPRPPVSNIPLDNVTSINKVKPNEMDKTKKTEETDEEELPETKKSAETVSVYNIGYMPQSQSFLQILDEIENPAVPKESNICRTQLVPQKSRNILSAPMISDEYDTIPKESCIPSTICTTLNELVTKPSAKEPQTESDLNLKVQLVPNKSSNILSDLIEPNKHDANRGASFITSNTSNILNEVDREPNGQGSRTDSITIPKTSHDSMKSNVKISTTNVLNAITKSSSTNEFKEPDGKTSNTEVMVLDESLIKPFSFED